MSDNDNANPQDAAIEDEAAIEEIAPLLIAIEPPADAPLTPPPPAGHTAVLKKLSSPPFPKSGFPLLGILASVYEHVMIVAARTESQSSAAATPAQPDRAA